MHTPAPTTPPPRRILESDLADLHLDIGAHQNPQSGHCLMEVVSMFAGEPFSDSPACVDRVLAAFGRTWNDGLPQDERQALKQYIPQLVGTAQGEELSQRRGWMAADWLVRTCTPAWLELSPALAEHAAKLRALAPITGEQELASARPALDQAQQAAAAARDAAWAAARDAAFAAARDAAFAAAWAAAWDAAWAAARDAAWAAARDAAWAAARDAARDAAWDAARDAAWAAAWAAARDAARDTARDTAWDAAWDAAAARLESTRAALQASAHELYARMIAAQPLEA
jgi:hypothetical protein